MDICRKCNGTGRLIEPRTNCACPYCRGSGLEPVKPKIRKVRCYHCNGTGRLIEPRTNCACPYCKGSGIEEVEEKDFHPGTGFIDDWF